MGTKVRATATTENPFFLGIAYKNQANNIKKYIFSLKIIAICTFFTRFEQVLLAEETAKKQLCKNCFAMENLALIRSYEILADLLAGSRVYRDPTLTFPALCRMAGADPRLMQALLEAELGLGGEALLEALRRTDPSVLSRKSYPCEKK